MRVPTRFFLKTMALAGCLAVSLAVAGCNQQATSDDAARVDELEQQVADLQAQLDEQPQQESQDTEADQGAASDSEGKQPQSSASSQELDDAVTSEYPEIADFEKRVAELEKTCAAVEVSSDRSTNYQTFIDVKHQIETLEHEMDGFDEEQEYAAQSGSLPYEDYMTIERSIDRLEDRLDHAEDGMEITLGIDD